MMFYLEPARLRRWEEVTKRTIDLTLAGLGLVVGSPVLLACAVAVRLQDGGSPFFRQVRVGRGGAHFTLLKLRTMVPDAEDQVVELGAQNQRDGILFKLDDDPRVTRVGRLLRATSLDELPQLINVLRGEMSLVGPRPALPSEVAQFDERLLARHQVTPGVTGLWQVEAREVPGLGAYTRLDLFYVENWSVLLDLAILIATMSAVVTRAVRVLSGRSSVPSA
jgi:lipopolysaccharide/colanic/teichoic acid biosynthesis glycosyltransferase